MNFDSAKNALHGFYKSVAEYVTPISQESHFNEKGVLTPEEFLKAGSELVYKCPTWSWEKASDDSKKWKFFPDNQQYLLTRNVPCLKRVASLELKDGNEEIVENGEWLSAYAHSQNKANEEEDMGEIQDEMESLKIKESKSKPLNKNQNPNQNQNNMIHIVEDAFEAPKEKPKHNTNNSSNEKPSSNKKEEKKIIKKNDDELSDSFEEIPDIESFNDNDNVVSAKENKKTDKKLIKNEEENQVISQVESEEKQLNENLEKSNPNPSEIIEEPLNNFFSKQQEDEDEDTIVKTRTYDISITYDKYYRVPRVWLRGYDENNNPLTSQQIMQDISSDHAHKTVTIEPHPHTGVVCASIHPCRHSEVMKRFMDRLEESGKALTVNQYMFLFLKFLSAVIPTIEYDWTSGMDAQ